jgi:hypothetical protein
VALVKSLTIALPILALPAVVGEVTYLALQAVQFEIGAAELVRVAGAVATAWMAFLTGLAWRTYRLTSLDHQLLHGLKDSPGVVTQLADVRRRVGDLPDDIERRFDGAVGRMQEYGAKLEGRIERLEDQRMGERE